MKDNNKICELSYAERLKIDFKEGSLLYLFYLWLYEITHKKNKLQKIN